MDQCKSIMNDKIEYKDIIELICDYGEKNDNMSIFEYKVFYCQNTQFDNIGFFTCNNFEELCDIVYTYLKKHKYTKYKMELETKFNDIDMEMRIDNDFYVKIINCELKPKFSFSDNEEIFYTYMKNKNINISNF